MRGRRGGSSVECVLRTKTCSIPGAAIVSFRGLEVKLSFWFICIDSWAINYPICVNKLPLVCDKTTLNHSLKHSSHSLSVHFIITLKYLHQELTASKVKYPVTQPLIIIIQY